MASSRKWTEAELAVAGKANCGCWYAAWDGEPCEHDLALLQPSTVPDPPVEIPQPETLDEFLQDFG